MDLSIVTNFLNFLLMYNIVFFLKQCFTIIFRHQALKYAELTTISTVVTIYNDSFKLFFTIKGAVAHGFSFKEYRLSVANRVYEKESKSTSGRIFTHGRQRVVKNWKDYSELRVLTPDSAEFRMTYEEKVEFGQFLEFIKELSWENESGLWKICLLSHIHIQEPMHPSVFFEKFKTLDPNLRDSDSRLTKILVISMKAALDIAKSLRACDLKINYVLFTEGRKQRIGLTINAFGPLSMVGPYRLTCLCPEIEHNATIQSIADSVAHDHNLDSQKLYAAVLKAAEDFACYRRVPVRAAYDATGVLYNTSSSPAFKSSNSNNWIQTGSSSDYKSRSIMIAVGIDYSYKTSMAVIYGCICVHYFAVILFGAGQVIGITILGANVWNPFDSSKSHSVRDILHNNMKYTFVLSVVFVVNPVFLTCFESFQEWLSHNFEWVYEFFEKYCRKNSILTVLNRFDEYIIFADNSDHVLNVPTPLTLSTFTGISKGFLTYYEKMVEFTGQKIGFFQEVRPELSIVYFVFNFFVIPFVFLRGSKLCTRWFGEVYTDF